MSNTSTYQRYLKEELSRRCEANPRYSVRSFARNLGVDAGTLSKILNGKQQLSARMATSFLDKIDLDPDEKKRFLTSVHSERSGVSKKNGQNEFKGEDLSIDFYRVISDWYHLAIMEMTYLKDFEPEPIYLAKKLNISRTEAKLALDRLLDLGLLEKKEGKLIKVSKKLSTTDRHLTTPALRKNQKQFLEKSIQSLQNDPIENRNHTNMVMAIDSNKMELAKKMIREFQMTLCKELEAGDQDRVYNLSVSLFPVQMEDKGK